MRLSLIPAFATAFVCTQFPAKSQIDISRSQVTIRGEILTTDSSVANWTVELIPQIGVMQRIAPASDGSFDFDSVTPGPCKLRVLSAAGATLYDEPFTLRQDGQRVSIRVAPDAPRPDSKARSISVQQLAHKVPRKAQSEFNKGLTAIRKLQYPKAVEHYKAAIEIDPAFAAAHNDLGVAYLRLKDYPRSLEQFQAAVDLAPGYQPATDNLCLLLVQAKRYAQAAAAATTVLKRGVGTPITHYAAAVSLMAQGGSRYEVLEHLNRAKETMPEVRLLAATVLNDSGRRTEAAGELEAYLRTGAANKRPEVEAWLAELQR